MAKSNQKRLSIDFKSMDGLLDFVRQARWHGLLPDKSRVCFLDNLGNTRVSTTHTFIMRDPAQGHFKPFEKDGG